MSKYNNYDITGMYYSGYTIVRAYGCGGELVFGEEPYVPPFADKFQYTLSGSTYTIPCNSSSALDKINDIIASLPSGARSTDITDGIVGDCVTTINNNCFNQCTNLTSMTISSAVTTIGSNAFKNCPLPTLIIPSGVTVIQSHMCNGCTRLSSTNIPNGVTEIQNDAYYDCLSWLDITIPANVTSIGDSAFRTGYFDSDEPEMRAMMLNMNANRAVRVLATTPPTLGVTVFAILSGDIDVASYPIYVPAESLNAYKTATNWSYYANRIYPI